MLPSASPGRSIARPIDRDQLACLLEISLALAAWKEYGPDRWSLRCNPSSGNLHPTEAYVLSRNVPGLADGLHHYCALDHSLEQRARLLPRPGPLSLHIGLSSVCAREAWKYGERAFRYCQHDVGHALAALRYGAAALGWRAQWLEGVATAEIAALLGLDRMQDFGAAEPEEAELLLALGPPGELPRAEELIDWNGHADVLDPRPLYQWPVIAQVAQATSQPATECVPCAQAADATGGAAVAAATPAAEAPLRAATLYRQRRSAQGFDRNGSFSAAAFYSVLRAVVDTAAIPWDVWPATARLHLVLFVHRVDGLAPGIYALPRGASGARLLRSRLRPEFLWQTPPGCPADLPLVLLAESATAKVMRTISCHQAIAADGAFTLGMLAEFEAPLQAAPWRYRHLYWEAGLLGQVLYLQAERVQARGTGIGCYFDDLCHELLGLTDQSLQSLYHFTVGIPLIDSRITTLPPYAHLR